METATRAYMAPFLSTMNSMELAIYYLFQHEHNGVYGNYKGDGDYVVFAELFHYTHPPPLYLFVGLLTEEAGGLDDEYYYEQGEGKGV